MINDDYDYCYECGGYGDDYYYDDDGNLVCACGGTQDAGEVGAMYIGAVGRGEWCIYCKRCLKAEKAPTEAEAVEK